VLRHRDQVRGLGFLPDGGAVVLAGMDGTARVWGVPAAQTAGPPLVPFPDRPQPITQVAFSPNGRQLFTVTASGVMRWDASTQRLLGGPWRDGKTPVGCAAFAPDGRSVALGSWVKAPSLLVDARTGQPRGPGLKHPSTLRGLVFSPDSRGLLSILESAPVGQPALQAWDLSESPPRTRPGLGLPAKIHCAAYHPAGRLVLLGCRDGSAVLWDLDTGAAVAQPLPHPDAVEAVAVSADGKRAVTGCRDGTLWPWDLDTGQPVGRPFRHLAAVRSVAFSQDGRTLLTASADGTARFWDVDTGIPLGPALRHARAVNHAVFAPGGGLVLTGSDDGVAQGWRTPAGPVTGPAERIVLRVQSLTGLELDARGAVCAVEDSALAARRQRLRALGEPPER
jgi:WD40 repeat protein